jgi:hypothetical protein
MTSIRMHAPMACIFGLPASTSRWKNLARTGLNRTAVWVGRNSAFRSRAFPALLSRVRFRTLAPLRNSRGASPQYAAALWALGSRSTAGWSDSTLVAVFRPTPGTLSSNARSSDSPSLAATTASAAARTFAASFSSHPTVRSTDARAAPLRAGGASRPFSREANPNEHQAALRLLGVLPLAGAVVTADARFTHPDVAHRVLDSGGDYVLYAKGNQSQLKGDIEAAFAAEGGDCSPGGPRPVAGRR